MTTTNRLTIFDTTLRDGEQAPGFSLRIDEKLKMAHQLSLLGVDIIEAGFPITSEADAEAVRLVSTSVQGPVIAALARCHPADIDRAGWALSPAPRRRIHTFIATSDLHLERKLRMSKETCLEAAVAAVRQARQYTDDVQFSAEDATRSDLEFLCRVVEGVIAAGCTTVNLPDTVGFAVPHEITAFFTAILTRVPNATRATFSTHCHDDLGLAVANTLAAVAAGARQVECTINGVGERAGNASLEEIVMVTRVRADSLPYDTAVNTREIFPTSQMLSALTGENVQANKAIVGRNAFAHEAGIHQDGMLKDRRTYEIMRPEDVGVPQATLVLGKHSGRHAVQRRCEQLGVTLERQELDQVYRGVIDHADREKTVSDRDLSAIVARVRGDVKRPAAASVGHDFSTTPAESGYGHGV
jgi:2-isopropylmalate synthase